MAFPPQPRLFAALRGLNCSLCHPLTLTGFVCRFQLCRRGCPAPAAPSRRCPGSWSEPGPEGPCAGHPVQPQARGQAGNAELEVAYCQTNQYFRLAFPFVPRAALRAPNFSSFLFLTASFARHAKSELSFLTHHLFSCQV